MTTYNPQQQQAIEALNQNVIVSASAGAGKTTVLIARLMKRIIRDNVRIDEVCAMTFTEAAASEMKTRLLASLNDEYRKHESDFIAEQISLVETAQISTIHSFCLTIIKNYGYIIGVNPSRADNILDDAQTKLLQRQAMRKTFDQWLQNDYENLKYLLDVFSTNPLDYKSLENAIYDNANWLISKKDPERAVQSVKALYRATDFKDFPQEFKQIFFDFYLRQVREIIKDVQGIIAISDESYDPNDKKGKKYFEQSSMLLQVTEGLRTLESLIHQQDISFYDQIPTVCNFKVIADTKNDVYTEQRKRIEKTVNRIFENYMPLDEHFRLLNNQIETVSLLIKMTQDYIEAFSSLKEEENCLDFNDFESMALRILNENDGEISELVKHKYKEIMVDEFQDTNEYQDEIITKISTGNNIFRVGDIKQSIYRFRGAKPNIMQNLMLDDTTQNLYLSFNYRSKKDIVEYNNYVFDKLMNLTFGITYDEHDHVNVGIPAQSEDTHPVEIHIIEKHDNRFKKTSDQLRAQHIAQEIINYHSQGYRFKDMVILVRSHASKGYLKEAFEEYNIPHYIDDQSGFYKSEIIASVVALLNYATTFHDFYLVPVLTSPFYNYSDDQIAALKLMDASSIRKALEIENPELYQSLDDMVLSWRSKDLISIIQEIIQLNDVYNNTLSLQDKTNLDFLLEKAIQYQAVSVPTLQGFVRFVAEFKDDTSSEASPLNKDADIVTAMTIHQSKGLQFPIVFLWGMGRHAVRDHSDILLNDDTFGIGLNHVELPMRFVSRNLIRTVMEIKQDNEEIEENLRLLYVALTRPQKHLILVDVVKEYQPTSLDYQLLRNHKRKVDLLLAASPHNTVLRVIDGMELTENSLKPIEQEEISTIFTEKLPLTLDQEVPILTKNRDLNFDKSFEFATGFGSTLHEAVEKLPHRLWTEADLENFESKFKRRLQAYNQHSFTQELYRYPHIQQEVPYLIDGDAGVIDFYVYNETELILVDFKSDNAPLEIIVERYEDQIEAYKKALGIIYPELLIKTYIYSFHLNHYIPCLDS